MLAELPYNRFWDVNHVRKNLYKRLKNVKKEVLARDKAKFTGALSDKVINRLSRNVEQVCINNALTD